MPSADFAAAQQRIAARRALRARQQPSSTTTPSPRGPLSTSLLSLWTAIKGREGTHPAFRVGQVDAELLDDELLSLLKAQASEALKYFGHHIADTYASEILLALRLVLFKLSIWNNNASYGAHLQGLRYTDARVESPDRPPPSRVQKVLYGLLSVGGRYAWGKWEEYLLAAQEDYTHPQSARLQLASRVTEYLDSAHDIASLASFLVFLVNGRYRTLTDRLLRLRLTPTSHSTSREVSFEYLNRQLVWHAFTEFLLFLLPLVGISRWRRILVRSFAKAKSSLYALLGRAPSPSSEDDETKPTGELGFLPQRTCAICYRDQNPATATEQDVLSQSAGGGGGVVGSAATDITNPYEAVPCGDVYCFACLAQRIANEEGEGWTCLRCGALVTECRPWDGDVLETPRRTPSLGSGAAKSVGFATGEVGIGEKAGLREVEPMPEEDDEGGEEESFTEETRSEVEASRSLDWRDGLDESAEWARASETRSLDEDSHSEEYDEDEQEEGEELEYDQ
ncbi:hypothetical protein BU23DRAFT_549682 [Bimuria novae-zelandiae CBS 107.79]|uniref:Pex N-terminal domain-containing protein n=1 Tax=Bimuria novae-zelandiae CBS 107.79 TaxID=1447943 RepID=A0A6A5VNT3_9PLEO|nr:hypothetical protein BU23DRAFT_549682 [Bimuria novae-zelandiae CBS 107.79]